MKDTELIKAELAQCYGTQGYHHNALSKKVGVVYTDGVKKMIELCEAAWLFDIILSYQYKCRLDEDLSDRQFWTLTVNQEEKTAVVKCERDTDDVFITQEIEFTDFPLPEMRVWLSAGGCIIDDEPQIVLVAMLPSEY
jgi:hypothetical protein